MPDLEPAPPKLLTLSDEERARLQAALNELGKRIRDEWAATLRTLTEAMRPTIVWLTELSRRFEAAGLYDLDPTEIRIGELEADADDYAHVYRDTPLLASPGERATCAHACGLDPDHECQAAASTVLKHRNLAGGTTRMPICGPCHQSETAAKERADV